jgi:hypothetical protein
MSGAVWEAAAQQRLASVVDLVGDLEVWPPALKALAFSPHLDYTQRFKLVTFLLLNGCPPSLIEGWFQARGCLADAGAWAHVRSLCLAYADRGPAGDRFRARYHSFCTTRKEWRTLAGGPVPGLPPPPPPACADCGAIIEVWGEGGIFLPGWRAPGPTDPPGRFVQQQYMVCAACDREHHRAARETGLGTWPSRGGQIG